MCSHSCHLYFSPTDSPVNITQKKHFFLFIQKIFIGYLQILYLRGTLSDDKGIMHNKLTACFPLPSKWEFSLIIHSFNNYKLNPMRFPSKDLHTNSKENRSLRTNSLCISYHLQLHVGLSGLFSKSITCNLHVLGIHFRVWLGPYLFLKMQRSVHHTPALCCDCLSLWYGWWAVNSPLWPLCRSWSWLLQDYCSLP